MEGGVRISSTYTYNTSAIPTNPASPASTTLPLALFAAPVALASLEADVADEEPAEAVVVALVVFEAALSVADAPDAAAVDDVDDPLPLVVADAPPPLSSSSPAVIVTGLRFDRFGPGSTNVAVPGALASSPPSICTQLVVCETTLQSTSSVLG